MSLLYKRGVLISGLICVQELLKERCPHFRAILLCFAVDVFYVFFISGTGESLLVRQTSSTTVTITTSSRCSTPTRTRSTGEGRCFRSVWTPCRTAWNCRSLNGGLAVGGLGPTGIWRETPLSRDTKKGKSVVLITGVSSIQECPTTVLYPTESA